MSPLFIIFKAAVSKIRDTFINVDKQQDAHEFLVAFLDILKDEVEKFAKNSNEGIVEPVNNNFTYSIQHTLVCPHCNAVSKKVESYHDISLDVPYKQYIFKIGTLLTNSKDNRTFCERHAISLLCGINL